MANSSRIYVVTETTASGKSQRLVRATHQSQAIRHVVEPRFTAEVAEQDVLVDLAGKGTKVEDAGADTAGGSTTN